MTGSQIVPSLTALFAVLLGPLISIYVVRRQFAAQVLSANRQQWINTLRKKLSMILGLMPYYSMLKATGELTEAKGAELFERFYSVWTEVSLLINPAEADHCELVNEIEALIAFLANSPLSVNPDAIRGRIDPIVRHSQAILKREWVRVKRGR
jgi:hypothetical protein